MAQLRALILFLSISLLAGCETDAAKTGAETAPEIIEPEFSGETRAEETLRRDTLKIISAFLKADGCESADHVDSKVLFYEPRTGEQGHVWGREGWMVTGCSKPYPFYVTFSEDGRGGTLFSVSRR